MNPQKILVSAVLITAVIGSIIYLDSQKAWRAGNDAGISVIPRLSNDGEKNQVVSPEAKDVGGAKPSSDEKITSIQKSKKYMLAKEITTPNGFINTGPNPDGSAKPVTVGEFVGKKVMLIDFWTYSCINCQRTTPYLNAWYEKYSASGGSASGGKDKGLVIIGLHTPEFEFEKVYQNVLEATKRLEIKYPVVLDNDYSTWNAYQNRFWPRKYLIDIDGYVVYDHIGEGGYADTERAIQAALKERAQVLGLPNNIPTGTVNPQDVTTPSSTGVRSPEVYFGAMRNEYLGNGAQGSIGVQNMIVPQKTSSNTLYLAGAWDIQKEFAENKESGAVIKFKYSSKNVYFVASADKPVTATVLRDGVPITDERGADVDSTSHSTIRENRLYHLISGTDYGEHTLEIRIEGAGLQAYTFTFG